MEEGNGRVCCDLIATCDTFRAENLGFAELWRFE